MWLLDAYEHPNVNVSQRALVGAMIIFHIYRSRLTFYPELIKGWISWKKFLHSEKMSLAFTAKCYYVRKRKRLTKDEGGDYSRNAEECFLHENMRFGCEESDEENNDMNPDWEDAFEKSGLGINCVK